MSIFNYFKQEGTSQSAKVTFDQEKISKAKVVKLSTLNQEDSNLIGDLLGIPTFIKDHLFLEISCFLVISPSDNPKKEKFRWETLNQLGNFFLKRREQHKDLKSFLTNDFFLPKYPDRQGILDLLGLAYNNDRKRREILSNLNLYIKEGNGLKFLNKLVLWIIQSFLPEVKLNKVRYNVLQLSEDNLILLEKEVEMNVHFLLSKDDQENLSNLRSYFKRLGYDYLCNLKGWDQSKTQFCNYQLDSKPNDDSDYICRGLWLIISSNSFLLNSLTVKSGIDLKEIRKFNSYTDQGKGSLIDWRVGWQGWQEENMLQKYDRIITDLDSRRRIFNWNVESRIRQQEESRTRQQESQPYYVRNMEEEYKKMKRERLDRPRIRTLINRSWLLLILILGSLLVYLFFSSLQRKS